MMMMKLHSLMKSHAPSVEMETTSAIKSTVKPSSSATSKASQEEPEKTVIIRAELVTNASAVDAVRNILSTVEVQMPSPFVVPRKNFTNFSEAETGRRKVVSKEQSLNPDEVGAVPESMKKEATESHATSTKAKVVSSADDKSDKEEKT